MAGKPLAAFKLEKPDYDHIAVKEAVFPFARFLGVDPILGPEMRSTGEVMGIDRDFAMAFGKSQLGAGQILPSAGTVFVSVKESDKARIVAPVKELAAMGFNSSRRAARSAISKPTASSAKPSTRCLKAGRISSMR